MRIHLLAVGKQMPAWVQQGFEEYRKRLPSQCELVLHEISAGRRGKNSDIDRILRDEGERLLAAVPARARVIALDRMGRQLNSPGLAAELERAMQEGEDWAWLIGGPEGLSPHCLQVARSHWSLSALTLAHPVVRVVLAEQLYRAWSIVQGLPYHR